MEDADGKRETQSKRKPRNRESVNDKVMQGREGEAEKADVMLRKRL